MKKTTGDRATRSPNSKVGKAMLTANEVDYELVMTRGRAKELLSGMDEQEVWALDFETTSLDPREGRVRLTTIWNESGGYVLDHDSCGSFNDLAELFVGPLFVVFAIGFEGRWFLHNLSDEGGEAIRLLDVAFMRRAKMGGGWPHKLAEMASVDLKVKMSKDLQVSAWGDKILTTNQLDYAAFDGYVTWELYKKWNAELTAKQWAGVWIINSAWRGNIEMEETGLPLDVPYHVRNMRTWKIKQQTALRYFRKLTPESVIANINSNYQMDAFLRNELDAATIAAWPKTGKTKKMQMEREILKSAAYGMPYPMNRWLVAFIIYRYWSKYLSTYGETLVAINAQRGRIKSRFNMAAAVTCRYSSSSPNAQNIPRKPYIRKAFSFTPQGGTTMVLADYSGIEVRVLAEISGDEQLRHDVIYGNVHGEAAALINGIDSDEFMGVLEDKKHKNFYRFKELRNGAKVFNFRLLYGAGNGALAQSLKTSVEDAGKAVSAWAERYPKAYGQRYIAEGEMNRDGFLNVCDGRTIYVRRADRALPVAANYPVQGAAASVMYRAVYHTRRNFARKGVNAYLMACVHDELLSECVRREAEEALDLQLASMTQAWLDIFPGSSTANLLDSAIGDAWSDKP